MQEDAEESQVSGETAGAEYAESLVSKQSVWWKRLLPVQLPYRLNLRRQRLGVTLDVGCGIGRNLDVLPEGSLGVDHNAQSVAYARQQGRDALTVDEFGASDRAVPGAFDAILLSHVVEHMTHDDAVGLLNAYLPYVRSGGKVFFNCPQERGFASDATHVWFATDSDLRDLAREVGLEPVKSYSFPFPRRLGRAFVYNEFCVLARKP